jgi:DNA-directed RNA polymerase specialized sigma24 family protein
MGEKEVYSELREVRRLNRRNINDELVERYVALFERLSPLQRVVMTECYVRGASYEACGRKIYYCERQVKRIIKQCIERLLNLQREA